MSERSGNLVVNDRIQIPHTEFEFTFARSSGPGGQNVNKVNSKATLRWFPKTSPTLPADVRQRFLHRFGMRLTSEGELLIVSQVYRDQGRNVADCLERLREMLLLVAVAPRTRRQTKPTRGSKERRLQAKRGRSDVKKLRQKPASGD